MWVKIWEGENGSLKIVEEIIAWSPGCGAETMNYGPLEKNKIKLNLKNKKLFGLIKKRNNRCKFSILKRYNRV